MGTKVVEIKGRKESFTAVVVEGACAYRWGWENELVCERVHVVVRSVEAGRNFCIFHEGGEWGNMREPRGVDAWGIKWGKREYEKSFPTRECVENGRGGPGRGGSWHW